MAVKSSEDSGTVTFQTAEFDARPRKSCLLSATAKRRLSRSGARVDVSLRVSHKQRWVCESGTGKATPVTKSGPSGGPNPASSIPATIAKLRRP